MSFSRKQNAHYRPLVARAWIAECHHSGQAPNDKAACDAWYRRQLHEAGNWDSTTECDKVKDFDAVMLHFAILANDEHWINKIAFADNQRLIYIIEQRLQMIGHLEGTTLTWSYAQSIYRHMQLPAQIQDCPPQLLWKVLQALDTHYRRLLKTVEPVLHRTPVQVQEEIPF